MVNSLSTFLHRLADWRAIAAFSLLAALFALLIVPAAQGEIESLSNGVSLIDLELYYNTEKLFSMIEAYGDEGREVYRNFAMTWDLLYPVVYSTLLALFMSWLIQRSVDRTSQMRLLNLLPFGAMLFDWTENASVIALLTVYPDKPSLIAHLASIATALKWAISAVALAVMAGFLGAAVRGGFKRRWDAR